MQITSSHGDHTHSSGYSIVTLHYSPPESLRTTKTHPLRTDRSYEGPQNPTRETPLVTLDADHSKSRGPHPLQRIQHRDPSLHTSGMITYYQNTTPTYRQKSRGTPKSHQGDSTSHPECRSPQATETTLIPAHKPSLLTAGIITYYQNTPPTYRQKLRRTPKSHQGDSTCHPGCRSFKVTGTTPTPANTA